MRNTIFALLAALSLLGCDPSDLTNEVVDGGPTVDSGPPGDAPDRVAPSFAGATSLTAVSTDQLQIRWGAASDDVSAPERLNYRVYVAEAAGAQDLDAPFTSATGVTAITLAGLAEGTTY